MHRHRRHYRLTRTDVAFQQPVHRLRMREVLENLPGGRSLGVGELERQRGHEGARRGLVEWNRIRRVRLAGALGLLDGDLVEEHLLETEAVTRLVEGLQRVRK